MAVDHAALRVRDGSVWTVSDNEDGSRGYLEVTDDLPVERDALVGIFVVLATREFDVLYDPSLITVSDQPKGFRWSERREAMIPARKTADSWWWVFSGLHQALIRAEGASA